MAKKRSDGRYVRKVALGDGTVKYVYGATDKEARRKAEDLITRLRQGERIQAGDRTFSWWADSYADHKLPELSPNYAAGLQGRIDFWKSHMGGLPIGRIEVSDVQAGLNEKAGETRGAKPLSKKTVNDYKNTACAIFEWAARERAITYNPAKYAEVSRKSPKVQQRFALNKQEIGWVNSTPHRAQIAALIMLYAGLRRGELLALQVRDIDFTENVIRINKTVYYEGNAPFVKRGGKTDAATRTVPMPDVLTGHLRKGLAGRSPMELVLPGPDGKLMSESAFKRLWESYLCDLNAAHGQPAGRERSKFDPRGVPCAIRRFTPHCLRHTYATILHAAGVDVLTAQKLMGHSDVKTTLSIYTHLDDDEKKKDISKLNDYVAASI